MAVVFHRLAAQEFVEARRWYGLRTAQAETRFVTAVADALIFLEANPLLAPVYRGNHRWHRVRQFPYVIYYEAIAAGTIYVYAIAHARRRPGYWVRRVNRP